MSESDRRPNPLHVVEGGLAVVTAGRSIRMHLVSGESPPGAVDATAFEEDTHLVLSAPNVIDGPREHPIRLMTALVETKPVPPGGIVVRGERPPYRFLAVVHDVERSPTWCETWVEAALGNLLAEAERRSVHRLALPVLAARHGRLGAERFAEILRGVLDTFEPHALEACWLLLPPLHPHERGAVERALRG